MRYSKGLRFKGIYSTVVVLNNSRKFYLDIWYNLVHSYATPAHSICLLCFIGMDELMEVSFSPIAASGKPLSRCGKCHRFMKYIQVSKTVKTGLKLSVIRLIPVLIIFGIWRLKGAQRSLVMHIPVYMINTSIPVTYYSMLIAQAPVMFINTNQQFLYC